MRNYRKIKVWKLSDELALKIYKVTRYFPKEEKFSMTSQFRRAACSVPANIAEGAGRKTLKDYLRFLDIAKGSLNETDYFLYLAYRLRYLQPERYEDIKELITQTSKCLTGLIKYIERELTDKRR
ncbi:MAG: four helix bundle protein [Victivallales bacterium]|nr:four helix bundle protein [Victivallales bacterium]